MKNTLLILLVVCVNFNLSSATSCSTHFTCGNCAAYKDCYWCPSTTKCEDYYGEKFANLICPGKWVQHDSLCPNTRHNVAGDSSADSALFNLLRGASSNEASNETPIESLLGGDNTGSTETSSQELKDLLHKLLLLKLLRKIKAQGTDSLTAQETKMLSQLAAFRQQGKIATPTTTTTTTKAPQSMNNEINQLLSILAAGKQVKATNAPEVLPGVSNITQKQIKAPITKPTKAAIETVPTALPVLKGSNKSETVMTLLKKIDAQNAGVEYQERPVESLSGPDVKHPSKSSPPPTPANARAETTKSPAQSTDGGKTTMREPSHQNTYSGYNYCKLYEEIDLCNSDRNCTWCNTKDVCIRRSDTDYQGCVAAKDNLKDKEFGMLTVNCFCLLFFSVEIQRASPFLILTYSEKKLDFRHPKNIRLVQDNSCFVAF